MSETRTRFLREIAARIPAERLVELHLFPALRQGGLESGVAVVAATPEPLPPALPAAPADALDAEPADVEPADDAPEPMVRHTVYTARYRATLKGPDRGKWEFSLVAEADAPLVTIDAVVRGVQRRSADAADPERLTVESLLALDEPWTTSTT